MTSESGSPVSPAAAPPAPWYRRKEPWLWSALLVFVVSIQWPMLKGTYYRSADRPAPPPSFEWRESLGEALAEARRERRPVFVDFHAAWCPPCIAMKHDVWPDTEVGRWLTERYVPLSIDVDRDVEAASARYNVRSIPTILVLDPDGNVLRRATYMSRPGMLRFLEAAMSNADPARAD
jgi:thiol:disulfide interchange protein